MKTVSQVISAAISLAIAVGLCYLANKVPAFVNLWFPRFSQWILGVIGGVTGKVAIPIWEIGLVLLTLWGIYTLIRSILKLKFLRWLSGLLWTVSFITLTFVLLWGAGHFLPTKTEQMVTVNEYSVEELHAATVYFGQKADETAGLGDFSDFSALAEKVGDGYAVLSDRYDCIPQTEVTVKKLLGGKLYNYLGLTGLFVPTTAEASVSAHCYPLSLPYTMAHEAAHRLGAAQEDDANFCAFLACIENPDPAYQYSAYFSAFVYCYNALYQANPELALETFQGLSQQVQTDIRGATEHYAPYKGKVQDAAQSVNDTYLKAMGQEGVRSYGLVSDALIAWYQQK